MIECPRCKIEIDPLFIETPDLSHHGKEVCPHCTGWLRWISKPKNETKRLQSKFTSDSLGIKYCEFCLRPQQMLGKRQTLEIHHKMPIELGGEDVKSNLLVLCTYCHKTAHQRQTYLYEHFKPKELSPDIKRETLQLNTQPSQPTISIPLITGEEFPVYSHHINEWKQAYPAVDIIQDLHKMRQWCLSNLRKRKTARGVRTFITNWLARTQDKGGNIALEAQKKPIDSRPAIWPS